MRVLLAALVLIFERNRANRPDSYVRINSEPFGAIPKYTRSEVGIAGYWGV